MGDTVSFSSLHWFLSYLKSCTTWFSLKLGEPSNIFESLLFAGHCAKTFTHITLYHSCKTRSLSLLAMFTFSCFSCHTNGFTCSASFIGSVSEYQVPLDSVLSPFFLFLRTSWVSLSSPLALSYIFVPIMSKFMSPDPVEVGKKAWLLPAPSTCSFHLPMRHSDLCAVPWTCQWIPTSRSLRLLFPVPGNSSLSVHMAASPSLQGISPEYVLWPRHPNQPLLQDPTSHSVPSSCHCCFLVRALILSEMALHVYLYTCLLTSGEVKSTKANALSSSPL